MARPILDPRALAKHAWRPLPLAVRATATAIAITGAGALPWSALALLNTRLAPGIPWCGPLAALWLWFYARWLAGHGPPRATSAGRGAALRARALEPRTWAWALLATASGFAALIATYVAASRLIRIPPAVVGSDLARYPLPLVVTGLIMTALTAAVSEEAGFRGYMQSLLLPRYGRAATIVMVAMVFALIHLSHGFSPARLMVNAAASVLLSLTVIRAGSILPGMVVHAASDVLVPLWGWRGHVTAPLPPVWEHGADAPFVGAGVVSVLCVAGAAWGYARLAATRVAGGAEGGDESPGAAAAR